MIRASHCMLLLANQFFSTTYLTPEKFWADISSQLISALKISAQELDSFCRQILAKKSPDTMVFHMITARDLKPFDNFFPHISDFLVFPDFRCAFDRSVAFSCLNIKN